MTRDRTGTGGGGDDWLHHALAHPALSGRHTMTGRYQRALLRFYVDHRHQLDGLPTSGRFL